MKPLNQAERRKAFLNFLLFFIITAICIIATVFFGMSVPFEENKKMKQQIDAYQKDQVFAVQFSGKTTDVQTLIDSLEKPNTQVEIIKTQITAALGDLQAFKEKNISGNDNIYAKILYALYDLQGAKVSLVNSGMQSQDMGKLQLEKATLNQRIIAANAQIDYLSAKLNVPTVHY